MFCIVAFFLVCAVPVGVVGSLFIVPLDAIRRTQRRVALCGRIMRACSHG